MFAAILVSKGKTVDTQAQFNLWSEKRMGAAAPFKEWVIDYFFMWEKRLLENVLLIRQPVLGKNL